MKNNDQYPGTIQYTTDTQLNALINERQHLLKLRDQGGFDMDLRVPNFTTAHRDRLKVVTSAINSINARKFATGCVSHAI